MSLSKADRNQRIEGVLAGLVGLRGVVSAAIVDGDGFVTHVRRDFEIDTDALGAASQLVRASASKASEQVAQGETRLVLCENKNGILLLAPLTRGFTLVLVADPTSMLGAVRFEMKVAVPEIDQLFAA